MIRSLIYFLFFTLIFYLISGCETNPVGSSNTTYYYNWPESSPNAVGLDSARIAAGIEQAGALGYVDGLVIIKDGFLVAEHYYNGYEKDTPHNVKSVSKSFLNAMIGAAVVNGDFSDLNAKVLTLFSEYHPDVTDPDFFNVTFLHLLKMRSGLRHDETIYGYIVNQPDWLRAIIAEPLIDTPGESFVYSTPATHLLASAFSRSINADLVQYAREVLFKPMGISIRNWARDPQGNYFGGNNMYFVPRDMARLGLLYLQGGQLGIQTLLSATWVDSALTPTTRYPNSDWGAITNIQYGQLWWLGEINGYAMFTAIGHGGQYIMCLPDLGMIIVSTAFSEIGSWDVADAHERAINQLFSDYFVPVNGTLLMQ